jgi:hypothetical protein
MAVAAIELRDLHFLHMAGIRQHDSAEIRRRRRGMDDAAKAGGLQLWQQAGMVNMRMGQQHSINLAWVEGKFLPIQGFERFWPLEHAAIHKESGAARVKK